MKINVRKMKTGLYFVTGLFLVLVVASALYFLLLYPLLEGKLKIYMSMAWTSLCIFGYYWLTKRYTNWHTIFEDDED